MLPRITILLMIVSPAGAAIVPSVNLGREFQLLELCVTSQSTTAVWSCSRGLEGQTAKQDFMALQQAPHRLLSEPSVKIRGHQRPSELFSAIKVTEAIPFCISEKPWELLNGISSQIQLDHGQT